MTLTLTQVHHVIRWLSTATEAGTFERFRASVITYRFCKAFRDTTTPDGFDYKLALMDQRKDELRREIL